MSKREKPRRKVFGLVSKLGNLIKKGGGTNTSNDNMDTSAGENETPKKSFNIHISEDNQEEIEIADDEEEEEEEDEPEQKAKTVLKNNEEDKDNNSYSKDNNNKNDNNLESKNKNDLTNINNNQINSNSNNQEIKNENNISNENKNNSTKNNAQKDSNNNSNDIISNKENRIPNNNNNKKEETKEIKNKEIKENENINIEEEDIIKNINEVCHLYLKKGNDFNSKEIYCIPITQIKNRKKKSVLQKMNVFKKVKNEVINFKIFFEENFIYFAKDIIIDKKNKDSRRICKIYNIRNIINYSSNKEIGSNKYKIEIDILNKKFIKKSKEYFVEETYYKDFNDIMNKKLKLYVDMGKN